MRLGRRCRRDTHVWDVLHRGCCVADTEEVSTERQRPREEDRATHPAESNISRNFLFAMLKACDFAARLLRSTAVPEHEPVVISSDSMKDSRPVRIVATLQAGCEFGS